MGKDALSLFEKDEENRARRSRLKDKIARPVQNAVGSLPGFSYASDATLEQFRHAARRQRQVGP